MASIHEFPLAWTIDAMDLQLHKPDVVAFIRESWDREGWVALSYQKTTGNS